MGLPISKRDDDDKRESKSQTKVLASVNARARTYCRREEWRVL
jgi:hypothetical protein